MTFTYSLKVTQADSKGGLRYQIGPALKISDETPKAYARSIVTANSHVLGSIIEPVKGDAFRSALGIEGGIILRYHARGGKAAYVLLHESGSLSPKPSP